MLANPKKKADKINAEVKKYKKLWDELCCKELQQIDDLGSQLRGDQLSLMLLNKELSETLRYYKETKNKQLTISIFVIAIVFLLLLIKGFMANSYDEYIMYNIKEMHKKRKIGPHAK